MKPRTQQITPLKYSLWQGLAIIISRMAVSGLRINFIHQHLAWTLPVRLPAFFSIELTDWLNDVKKIFNLGLTPQLVF